MPDGFEAIAKFNDRSLSAELRVAVTQQIKGFYWPGNGVGQD
jgi:hypothetical protein